ncbi:T9SS type A sorting domain-containing protein [Hymenobacter aerilatus]|uniref:T9SS type A sorting domain-containing protein n=1 Tax=Hymenobacter aerilatus TaxID=2932251 RepID=A0A8T9STX1_9BACT|nr:T9SS type A sorting domain-containing protein [Hymenobacter aerilatus]UOR04791.1 T9SS type A sorting domain-containing protein [Hymenobacter aerilatus]
MTTPASSSDAVKVKAEVNPVSKRLTVRTDIPGPVRVEVNDDEGRPVLTKDMISGDKAANIDVSRLPSGFYIVRCTSGERSGVRRVHLGQ